MYGYTHTFLASNFGGKTDFMETLILIIQARANQEQIPLYIIRDPLQVRVNYLGYRLGYS